MATAQTGGNLHDSGPVGCDPKLGVGRSLSNPEGLDGTSRYIGGGLAVVCLAGPGMRQRHAERRRVRRESVGDGERMEDAAGREGVDRDLRPLDELLDKNVTAPREGAGRGDRRPELGVRADEREPALALAIGGLDDAGRANRRGRSSRRSELPPRLGNTGVLEAPPLPQLRDGLGRGLGVERVRETEMGSDPGRDHDRPVDSGHNDPIDALRAGQPLDTDLVLVRHKRTTVRKLESDRSRVAVAGDDEERPPPRGAKKTELRRSRA